jgi:hypothetical protein
MRKKLHVSCHWLQSNQHIPGELTWENERLSFYPSGRARGMRKYQFQLERQAIDYLFYDQEAAHFISGKETFIFTGNQTKRILNAVHETEIASHSLLPQHATRILFEGPAEHMPSFMSVKGHLTLTNTDLSFEPTSALARFVPRSSVWKIILADITTINFSLSSMKLVIHTGDTKQILLGGYTSRLYGMIRAFSPQILKSLGIEQITGRFEEWEGNLFAGPLISHKGHLLIQRNRIFFTPASRFDAVAGAKAKEIDYKDTYAMRRGGLGSGRRIELCRAENDFNFMTDNSDERFGELLYDFMRDQESYDYHIAPNGQVDMDNATKLLQDKKRITSNESILFAGVACYEVESNCYIRGLLSMTDKHLIFWPNKVGRTKHRHIKISLSQLKRTPKQEAPILWTMGLKYKEQLLKFIPLGGGRFIDLFHEQMEFVRKVEEEEKSNEGLHERMTGRPILVQISTPQGETIKITGSVVQTDERGHLVFMCREDLMTELKFEPFSMQVMCEDGIFTFETKILKRNFIRGTDTKMPKFSFSLADSKNLEHVNRRKNVRASSLELTLQVYEVIPEEELKELNLPENEADEAGMLTYFHDISVNGCMLKSGPIFEEGLYIKTTLPITGNPLTLTAQCIRAVEPEITKDAEGAEESNNLWFYGFQFQNMTTKERSLIFQFITQQHVLAKKRLERDLHRWGILDQPSPM